MSSLIFYTDKDQAVVATDTLAVSPEGRPWSLTSKAFHLPHLRMLLAGTGCGGFLDRWLLHLNSRMIVPGVDALAVHAPASLNALWDEFRKGPSFPAGRTTTVYHFGFSETSNSMKTYVYRSENSFLNEELQFGVAVKPDCSVPEPYNLPDDFRIMMGEQRQLQRQRPANERIYIGGQIIVHHLAQGGCSTFSLGEFEDFEDDVKAIYSRFSADGTHS